MIFKPEIDNTYRLLSLGSILLLGVSIAIILAAQFNLLNIIIAVLLIAFVIYLLMMYNSIEYEITNDLVICRQPLLIKMIKISDIVKISDRYTLIGTPALLKMAMSNKTLTIRYKSGIQKKWITISPKEEEKFLEEILKINPSIEVERKRKR